MAKVKVNRDLVLNGSLGKAFLSLALPIIATSFIQTMYNLTDTFWLGKLGEANQAAITLVSPIQSIIQNLGSGLVSAGSVILSQYNGAGKKKESCDVASHVFVTTMLFSIICATLAFIFCPLIIMWLGAEGDVSHLAQTYLRIVILDMPFLFMINSFQIVKQSQGNTVSPMFLNLAGVILNMILDPLLMVVFDFGIGGAAFATLFAKVPCGIIALFFLFKQEEPIHVTLKGFRFNGKYIKQILTLGIPSAIGSATMQFGFLLMGKSVVKYGTVSVASYGIGNKVNGLISLPSNAMGSATGTIVGINVGADKYDRAQQAFRLSAAVSVAFLAIFGVIISRIPVSTALVSIFSSSPDVIKESAVFLSILALYSFTNGIYNSINGFFNGTGHSPIVVTVEAVRLWIFRFATLFLCERVLNMGFLSVPYSIVISNALAPAVMLILYKTKIWRRKTIKMD